MHTTTHEGSPAMTTTDQPKATTTLVWISVLGAAETLIEATLRDQRVLVDRDTLHLMASSAREANLTGEAETSAFCEAIRHAPQDGVSGLYDVTDLGGGWDEWQWMLVEEETASA